MTDDSRRYPPKPETVDERIDICMGLMARGLWERGETARELGKAWGLAKDTIEGYSAEAARTMTRLGDYKHWQERIRAGVRERLDGADDKDFVNLSRLAIDTVGGFVQKHEVKRELSWMPREQLVGHVIEQLMANDETRELVRAALAEWDERETLNLCSVQVISVLPNGSDNGSDSDDEGIDE